MTRRTVARVGDHDFGGMHRHLAAEPVDDHDVARANRLERVGHSDDRRDLQRARHDRGVTRPRPDLGHEGDRGLAHHARRVGGGEVARDHNHRLVEARNRGVRFPCERAHQPVAHELDVVPSLEDVGVTPGGVFRPEEARDLVARGGDRPLRVLSFVADLLLHELMEHRIAEHQEVRLEDQARCPVPRRRSSRRSGRNVDEALLCPRDGVMDALDLLHHLVRVNVSSREARPHVVEDDRGSHGDSGRPTDSVQDHRLEGARRIARRRGAGRWRGRDPRVGRRRDPARYPSDARRVLRRDRHGSSSPFRPGGGRLGGGWVTWALRSGSRSARRPHRRTPGPSRRWRARRGRSPSSRTAEGRP